MINLDNIIKDYQSDIDEVTAWEDKEYEKYFAKYFKGLNELREKLQTQLISDSELESILTVLPLNLISVAEELSKLTTMQEVIKRKIKEKEDKAELRFREEDMSATAAKKAASDEVADDKLLISVYTSLYDRVSRQITFSKELIMSAKKIWDARRNAEQPLPTVNNDDPADLPEYDIKKPSTYIK